MNLDDVLIELNKEKFKDQIRQQDISKESAADGDQGSEDVSMPLAPGCSSSDVVAGAPVCSSSCAPSDAEVTTDVPETSSCGGISVRCCSS